jgi:hypothetical protein
MMMLGSLLLKYSSKKEIRQRSAVSSINEIRSSFL